MMLDVVRGCRMHVKQFCNCQYCTWQQLEPICRIKEHFIQIHIKHVSVSIVAVIMVYSYPQLLGFVKTIMAYWIIRMC